MRAFEDGPADERTFCDDRHYLSDAGHRRIPHDAVHLVTLEYGLDEYRRYRRIGRGLNRRADCDRSAITIGPHDTRLKLAAMAIEHGDLVSRHETQNTDEVVRLV